MFMDSPIFIGGNQVLIGKIRPVTDSKNSIEEKINFSL
jgi:hypothetical protein